MIQPVVTCLRLVTQSLQKWSGFAASHQSLLLAANPLPQWVSTAFCTPSFVPQV